MMSLKIVSVSKCWNERSEILGVRACVRIREGGFVCLKGQ